MKQKFAALAALRRLPDGMHARTQRQTHRNDRNGAAHPIVCMQLLLVTCTHASHMHEPFPCLVTSFRSFSYYPPLSGAIEPESRSRAADLNCVDCPAHRVRHHGTWRLCSRRAPRASPTFLCAAAHRCASASIIPWWLLDLLYIHHPQTHSNLRGTAGRLILAVRVVRRIACVINERHGICGGNQTSWNRPQMQTD